MFVWSTVAIHALFTSHCLKLLSPGTSGAASHPGGIDNRQTLQYLIPLDFALLSKGSGIGTFTVDGMSMSGIGNTTGLGYVNTVHESIMTRGAFDFGGDIHWTSFRETFDEPEVGIQVQP